MGIRIKKVLGYGLTDVKSEDCSLIDDRFDPLGFALADWEDREDIWEREGFLTYCKNHMGKFDWHMTKWIFREKRRLDTWEPYDSIFYDPEFGMSNVFLISIPSYLDWCRNDNIIDYHEDGQRFHGMGERVEEIDGGIYPYQSSYIDRRTGKDLSNKAHEWWYHYRNWKYEYENKPEDFDGEVAMRLILTKLARDLRFKDFFDAKKNIGPRIPPEIVAFCKYLNLFNDESTIWQLKSLLYVYWS